VDSAALRFLIESLNDDGYLEESLQELAIALAGPDDLEQIDELVHRFTVACACCKPWSPWAWAPATWPSASRCSCALAADAHSGVPPDVVQTALQICGSRWTCWPAATCAASPRLHRRRCCGRRAHPRRHGPDRRLEPRPGGALDVERNIIDVIVRKAGRSNGTSGQQNFIVQLNPDVMPRLRVHDIYAPCAAQGKGGEGHAGCSSACRKRAGSSRTSSSASTPSCASRAPSSSGRRASSPTASWPCARWCCARSPTSWACTNPPSAA
jgi:RNA polymerase sigma-54 factor